MLESLVAGGPNDVACFDWRQSLVVPIPFGLSFAVILIESLGYMISLLLFKSRINGRIIVNFLFAIFERVFVALKCGKTCAGRGITFVLWSSEIGLPFIMASIAQKLSLFQQLIFEGILLLGLIEACYSGRL